MYKNNKFEAQSSEYSIFVYLSPAHIQLRRHLPNTFRKFSYKAHFMKPYRHPVHCAFLNWFPVTDCSIIFNIYLRVGL